MNLIGRRVWGYGLCASLAGFGRCDSTEEPTCSRITGIPSSFVDTDIDEYDGPAQVTSVADGGPATGVTDGIITLALLDLEGETLEVRVRGESLRQLFPEGRMVHATVMSGGEANLSYVLVVLRDEEGELLFVYHEGGDELYEEGLFADESTLGFSLELQVLCSESVADGCFEHQVQRDFVGVFGADETSVLDGAEPATLIIDTRTYSVTFWSTSVEGGRSLCNTDILPGRYLTLRVEPDPG